MRYHATMSVSALTPSPNSTRPYLLRALYEWCTDNGYTPYIAAYVDETVQVPREHVKNNEIVLNISMDATSSLKLGNEFVQFKARFSGTAREIMVPIDRVIAIYARENGQGMAFPVPQAVPPRGEVTEPEAKVHLLGKKSSETATTDTTTHEAVHDIAQTDKHSTESAPSKIVQLVSSQPDTATETDTSSEGTQSEDDLPPTPPQPPAGARPALKRVK
jgi:stringent starvation protein B